jgi:hypothetical protein
MKARADSVWAVIKPHRNSVGVVWRNQVFWWSTKGMYRTGNSIGKRRCFHHVLWEHYHRRPMPEGHEIFFLDRDYHNFTKPNLKLMTKASVHRLTIDLGEVTQLTAEQRTKISAKRWERSGNRLTGFLLDKFNTGGKTVAAQLTQDR